MFKSCFKIKLELIHYSKFWSNTHITLRRHWNQSKRFELFFKPPGIVDYIQIYLEDWLENPPQLCMLHLCDSFNLWPLGCVRDGWFVNQSKRGSKWRQFWFRLSFSTFTKNNYGKESTRETTTRNWLNFNFFYKVYIFYILPLFDINVKFFRDVFYLTPNKLGLHLLDLHHRRPMHFSDLWSSVLSSSRHIFKSLKDLNI